MSTSDNIWLKKIRTLYQILILSLSLNAGLILAISYKGVKNCVKSRKANTRIQIKRASKLAVLEAFFELNSNQLVDLLSSKDHIEDGLCYRDIALSCLVSFHDFAIEKVFLQNPAEKRELGICRSKTSETVVMQLFLGLDDQDFSSIQNFARKERFPVTLKGLFFLIKDDAMKGEFENLCHQIYIQEPFCALYSLMKKAVVKLEKKTLLQLILSSEYTLFEEFYLKALEASDSETNTVLFFLKKYLMKGSTLACQLLMNINQDYCVHHLDQGELLQFIHLLDKPNFDIVITLKRLLCSVRATEIHKAAAKKLYEFSGQEMPEPYDHKKALKQFLPTFYSSNINSYSKKS